MVLILGGTAAYFLDLELAFGATEQVILDTPYGPSFPILMPSNHQQSSHTSHNPHLPIAFASRHGLQRLDVTPPFVNARANIWAAHALGVRAIFSWNGVGAINPILEVHDMLILDNILDFTKTRVRSFSQAHAYTHTPANTEQALEPWHSYPLETGEQALQQRIAHLRLALYQATRATTARAFSCGTYACSEGPRLETAAEIRLLRQLGADVVGMTLIPEVYLAHELGIAFASLAYVTNYATGVEPVGDAPRHFGVDVAQRCLDIVRTAVTQLTDMV